MLSSMVLRDLAGDENGASLKEQRIEQKKQDPYRGSTTQRRRCHDRIRRFARTFD
jgi:hypothetical protein